MTKSRLCEHTRSWLDQVWLLSADQTHVSGFIWQKITRGNVVKWSKTVSCQWIRTVLTRLVEPFEHDFFFYPVLQNLNHRRERTQHLQSYTHQNWHSRDGDVDPIKEIIVYQQSAVQHTSYLTHKITVRDTSTCRNDPCVVFCASQRDSSAFGAKFWMLWTLTFHSEPILYLNLKRCDYFFPSVFPSVLSPSNWTRRADQVSSASVFLYTARWSRFPIVQQFYRVLFPSHFRLPAVLPLCPGVLQRLCLLLVHLHVVHTLFIQQRFLETKTSQKRHYIKHTVPWKHDIINTDMQKSTIYKYRVLIFLKSQLLHRETWNTKGSRLSFVIFFNCVNLIQFFFVPVLCISSNSFWFRAALWCSG